LRPGENKQAETFTWSKAPACCSLGFFGSYGDRKKQLGIFWFFEVAIVVSIPFQDLNVWGVNVLKEILTITMAARFPAFWVLCPEH
jgi:hypothetical protein